MLAQHLPHGSKGIERAKPITTRVLAIGEFESVQKFPLNNKQIEIITQSLPVGQRDCESVHHFLTNEEAFKNHLYSTPMLAYRIAKANPELYAACVTDELHVINGGNSFRKAGAVRVSEV
ncbi:MAG: hypothetical protein HRU09_20685 [Oligoflexales bacterium]|nr:hypothetical protein [Oligoflexales bacterium]